MVNLPGIPGQRFDHYVVERVTDTTAGLVCTARDIHSADSQFLVRFFRSDDAAAVRGLQALIHPNLESYIGSGAVTEGLLKGNAYVIRALTSGQPFPREPAMPSGPLISVLSGIASGLSFLHASGRIHGDLRPGNVSVFPSGHAHLLDFALHGIVPAHLESTLRRKGLRYSSPESLDGAIGPPADIYAFGVLIVDLIAGTTQHKHPSIWSAPAVIPSDLSDNWRELIAACLHPDPSCRATIRDVCEALDFGVTSGLTRAAALDALSDPKLVRHLTKVVGPWSRYSLPGVDPRDVINDTIAYLFTRITEDPAFAARFPTRESLHRYASVDARYRVQRLWDPHASGQPGLEGLERHLPDALKVEDVALLFHREQEALIDLEAEVGPHAAKILRLRSYGETYDAIARILSANDDPWSPERVFILLYRLRRAYPELVSVLPPSGVDEERNFLYSWLRSTSTLTDERDAQLVASRLAGESISDLAQRLKSSKYALSSRLYRLRRGDPWLEFLLRPSVALPDHYFELAQLAESNAMPPDLGTLDSGWIDDIRATATEIFSEVSVASLSTEDQNGALADAVDAILRDVSIAVELRTTLLNEKMLSLSEAVQRFEMEPEYGAEELARLHAAGEVILVTDHDEKLFPEFQFVHDQGVSSLVRTICRMLGARDDPFGVLGWWVQPNGRLEGAAPKELLGHRDRELYLLDVARGTVESD